MSKRWTPDEDEFLLTYGPCVSYEYVASHDLGRSKSSGPRRAAWLKKNRPELVCEIAKQGAQFEAWMNGFKDEMVAF